jgi:V8-like Glu-specific endopeptidase
MTRTRSLASGLLSFSAAAVLALTTAGGASAAPASPTASDDKLLPSIVRLAGAGPEAADYWTSERMQNAVPGDVLAGKALEKGNRSNPAVVEKGKNTKVKASKTKAAKLGTVSHVGKVFFTMGGSNYVCSGNAVSSENRSTVATAGHCVLGGPGQEATNFSFVPAYENGLAPYGQWTAKDLYTTRQWSSSGDLTYDTAFAVMNPLDGKLLTDEVGGSGVAFNEDHGLTYTAFGYPADKPFNGQTLQSCTGTATGDTVHTTFDTQGIPCDMTSGSSGGPWFIDGSEGLQNSINSYGYSGSKVMYGPYWGAAIEEAYEVASKS